MTPIISFLVAIVFVFAVDANAGQQTRNVFAPTQVVPTTRGGAASTTLPFEIAWPVSCPCTLHVVNGAPDSGVVSPTRISAGWVWVDGLSVLTPRQLSLPRAIANVALDLAAGTHHVRVELVGRSTSFVTVSVTGTITTADLTEARVSHTATLMPDGTIVVAGGTGESDVLNSVERISAQADRVDPAASLLIRRAGHAAALVPGGGILMSGGHDASAGLSDVEVWTTVGAVAGVPFDEVRFAHTATTLIDGRVLILGGRNANGDALNTGVIVDPRPDAFTDDTYNPASGAITTLGSVMQVPRAGHSATGLADGRILIAGGRSGAVDLSSIEIFDPATSTSTLLPVVLGTARANHTATLRSDGSVLVIGGRNGSTLLSSIERILPTLDSVEPAGDINLARADHSATVIQSGEILIAGGMTASGPTANTELGPAPPGDEMPAIIAVTSPIAAAVDVERGVVIGVRASEPLDPSTVNAQTVAVRNGAGVLIAASIGITDHGSMIGIRPDVLLPGGTYTVSLNGITDRAGLAIAPHSFTFTIVPAPIIAALTPSEGAAGTEVAVSGSGFGDDPADHLLSFGTLLVSVVPVDANTLRFIVPSLPLGDYPVALRTRGGLTTAPAAFRVESAGPPPTALSIFPRGMSLSIGGLHQFTAEARFADGAAVDITGTASWLSSAANVVTVSASGVASAAAEGTSTITVSFGGLSAEADVRVYTGESIPPDPTDVAPELSAIEPASMADSVRFLYEGQNPIQRGVTPGAIEALRVSVVRGRVATRDGQPLEGVRVAVKDHPEFGYTLTRLDGGFDMAVNGGGSVVVEFTKDGYLPIQRRNVVPSAEFQRIDVVLIALDPQVTAVDLSAATPIAVAQGSVVTDESGSRQATVLFPQGTTAAMVLPDGTTQPLTTLHVRATEYTVGPNGPAAMPGTLPPASGYTYAVELSADEAIAAGATSVQFSSAVPFYVENFLGFPAGTAVPVGYYDREIAAWVPSDTGIVLQIISVGGDGRAEIDLDGDALPDEDTAVAAFGITDAERMMLATTYTAGQSLWRVALTHFTPVDPNWPLTLTNDADLTPTLSPPSGGDPQSETDCETPGSIIECQDQVLGERLPIAGTPFTLNYRSDRMPGRDAHTLSIPLTEATVPSSLERIDLEITIAGRRFTQSFAPAAGQVAEFEWDGGDVYGRSVSGVHTANIQIQHFYRAFYVSPLYFTGLLNPDAIFGLPADADGDPVIVPGRQIGSVPVKWSVPVGTPAPSVGPVAGWSIDVHHSFLPASQTVLFGDGRRRTKAAAGVTPVDLPPEIGFSGRTTVAAGAVYYTARMPDFTVAIFRKAPTGPPVNIGAVPFDVNFVVDPDGVVYYPFCESNTDVTIYRLRQGEGATAMVTGSLPAGEICKGGFIARAQDGTLFVDTTTEVFQRLPGGPLVPIGGSNKSSGIAVGPDGSVYRAVQMPSTPTTLGQAVERLDPTGAITVIAGGKRNATGLGGGGLAVDATFGGILDLAAANDGSVLVVSRLNGVYRLQHVTPAGRMFTIAGGVAWPPCCLNPPPPANLLDPGTPATSVPDFGQVEFSDDGWVYLFGRLSYRLRLGLVDGVMRMAADDGSEIYEFTASGRHTRTLDALTGATRYTFSYDPSGRLTAIVDGDGLVTELERDATGAVARIVAPFGQTTALTHDGNGWLETIVAPGNRTTTLTTTASGLLTDFVDANGNAYSFTYDEAGRLIHDAGPADGSETLARSVLPGGGWETTVTSGMGRVRRYRTEILAATGAQKLTVTAADGTSSVTTSFPDRSRETVTADGMRTTVTMIPDPRFGLDAPVPQTVTVTSPAPFPARRVMTTTRSRTLTWPNPNDLSTLVQTDDTRVNNRLWRTVFTGATRTIRTTSPAGRVTTSTLDEQGRVTRTQVGTLAPIDFTYDAQGRLTTTTQGPRVSTIAYDASGRPSVLTDALARTVQFDYDAADRVSTQTLPDTRTIGFDYDDNSNVTSLTPPGRPAHTFTYTPVDLTSSYTPPAVAGTGPTGYVFNADRQPTEVQRPDGQTTLFTYGATNGRLTGVTFSRGTLSYGYDSAGRISSLSDPGGVTLFYNYDGALPLRETWSGAVNGSVSRTFDNDFGIASEFVNTHGVGFTYDADRLLTGAGALTIARQPATGLISSTTLGTTTDSYTYNNFGEPERQTAVANAVQVFDVQIARDDLGRITQRIEVVDGNMRVFHYGYDLAGRLQAVTRDSIGGPPVTVVAYTYDANGNRLTAEGEAHGGGLPIMATYDDQDRLLTYGDATYTYTANGELHTKTVGGQTTSYVYDTLGNLIQVTKPNGGVITYSIDGLGRRVGKSINGVRVKGWLYADQLRPIAELTAAGEVLSRFVYGTKANVPEYMIRNGVTYRIFSDHLGSPRVVANVATGEIIQRMDFHAFGEIIQDSNPGWQPFGFAGGLYDGEAGTVRFGARDYDAVTGRWLAKDPLRFSGGAPNLYAYAGNDPVNAIDPTGLKCRSFAERWWDSFVQTNKSIPGIATPTGLTLATSSITAAALRAPTLLQWALTGFRGIGQFTAMETGIIAAGAAAVNALYFGTAFEIGVGLGSAIDAALTSGECRNCGDQK